MVRLRNLSLLSLVPLIFGALGTTAPSAPSWWPTVHVIANNAIADPSVRIAPASGDSTVYHRLQITDVHHLRGTTEFSFRAAPGWYEAFFGGDAPPSKTLNQSGLHSAVCMPNGPLMVVPGFDRHITVDARTCYTADWHDRAVLAGALPQSGLSVTLLEFDAPARCGDAVPRAIQQRRATIDGGAYYVQFYGYGPAHRLALRIDGPFIQRTILLQTITSRQGTSATLRNITTAALSDETDPNGNRLSCAAGF